MNMLRATAFLTLKIQILLIGDSLDSTASFNNRETCSRDQTCTFQVFNPRVDRCGGSKGDPLYCTHGHHCCSSITGYCCVDGDVCTPGNNGCISIGLLVAGVVVGLVVLLLIILSLVKVLSVLSKKRIHPALARLPPKSKKFKPDPKYPILDN